MISWKYIKMKIEGNQIKVGNIIQHKEKLWRVVKTQHTQPGKGGAYLQVELKDIKSGTKLNERFRSSESLEKIRLEEKKYQYLYKDENGFYFMDNETFDQINLNKKFIPNMQESFLIENSIVTIESYNEEAISLKLPDSVMLKVVEADAVIKGQTATSSYKPAVLENKFKTLVPPHIDIGDKVIISTSDGSYLEKAKD